MEKKLSSSQIVEINVEIVDKENAVVSTGVLRGKARHLQLRIGKPQLWYPKGMGHKPAYLYTVKVGTIKVTSLLKHENATLKSSNRRPIQIRTPTRLGIYSKTTSRIYSKLTVYGQVYNRQLTMKDRRYR